MPATSLPVHPSARHPLTGAPLQALGRTKSGRLIWPVLGASQPTEQPPGQPAPPAPPQPIPTPAQVAERLQLPGTTNPNPPPVMGNPPHPSTPPGSSLVNNADGYPDGVAVAHMAPEQQAAYWRHYARRNEERLNAMTDYPQLKEQAEAYKRHMEATQTEQQRAVAEAELRGRKTAMAEVGGQMVEAYVRAAAVGRMSEEQVSTLLQGLDRARFVNPATGQVDAQMVSGYIGMLAPPPMASVVPGYPVAVPGGYPPAPAVVYPPPPGYAPPPGQQQPGQQPQPGQPLTYPPQPGAPATFNAYPPPAVAAELPRQVPHYGQGQYPQPPLQGLEAGKAIARARFGDKRPASQQQ